MNKHLALTLAAGTLIMAGCSKSPPTVKYEYQTVHTIKGVNERTAMGWTVTNITVKPDGSKDYLLQRPIQ